MKSEISEFPILTKKMFIGFVLYTLKWVRAEFQKRGLIVSPLVKIKVKNMFVLRNILIQFIKIYKAATYLADNQTMLNPDPRTIEA